MEVVGQFVSERAERDQVTAVVSICSDKEVRKVLEIVGRFSSSIVLTRSNNPRAMEPQDMLQLVPSGMEVSINRDPMSALEQAVRETGEKGLVIVTGSLFLVGEILGKTLN
jgi:dihydrofolate synthase/folylpolyglutamate synthase